MCKLQAAIAVAALLLAGSATVRAQAAEVLTIPYSEATPTLDGTNRCINFFPYHWESGPNGCDLMFPLTIPAGHVIHQISVLRGTLAPPVPAPDFFAALEVSDLQADTWQERFVWTSNDYVLGQTIENHRLMSQTKFGYPDEFTLAPNTAYQVYINMDGSSRLYGIQVTYD